MLLFTIVHCSGYCFCVTNYSGMSWYKLFYLAPGFVGQESGKGSAGGSCVGYSHMFIIQRFYWARCPSGLTHVVGSLLAVQGELGWGCYLEHLHVPLRHGELRLVRLLTRELTSPRASTLREPGRTCMAFPDLAMEILSTELYWSKQSQVHPNSVGEDPYFNSQWE